jgi:hypothetical protein
VVEGAGLEFQLHPNGCTWVRIPPSPPKKKPGKSRAFLFGECGEDENPPVFDKIARSNFGQALAWPVGRATGTSARNPTLDNPPSLLLQTIQFRQFFRIRARIFFREYGRYAAGVALIHQRVELGIQFPVLGFIGAAGGRVAF